MIRMKDILTEDANSQLPAEQCLQKQGFKYKPWYRGVTNLQSTRSKVDYGKLYMVKLMSPLSNINPSYIEVTIELATTPMLRVYSTTNAKTIKLSWTTCDALTQVIQKIEDTHEQDLRKKKTDTGLGNKQSIGQDPNFYRGKI